MNGVFAYSAPFRFKSQPQNFAAALGGRGFCFPFHSAGGIQNRLIPTIQVLQECSSVPGITAKATKRSPSMSHSLILLTTCSDPILKCCNSVHWEIIL